MKTIEEAAIEHMSKINLSQENKQYVCKGDFGISFHEGVEFAQRWINIKEESPKDGETVITIRKKINGKTYYHLNSMTNGKWNIAMPDTSEVTSWRPIVLK